MVARYGVTRTENASLALSLAREDDGELAGDGRTDGPGKGICMPSSPEAVSLTATERRTIAGVDDSAARRTGRTFWGPTPIRPHREPPR